MEGLDPGPEGANIMRCNLLFSLTGSAIACLALASVSQATVPRAFVSINGSDTNPCSAVQPCRSFNQALTVVQAGGEIVVQNSGGYSTGFTITQSVTIDAAGFNASVISTTATDLCTINAGPSDRVVLRGISFHGANVGQSAINATRIGSLYVEHCSISEFNSSGVRMFNGGNLWITDTSVRACSDGIDAGVSGATPAHLVAHDSLISESRNLGVLVVSNGTAPATGLLVNCTAALGNGPGFSATSDQSADVEITLVNCRSFGNSFGVTAESKSSGNATSRICGCVVTGNVTGIAVVAHSTGVPSVLGTSPGTNFISGNTTDGTTTGSVTLANRLSTGDPSGVRGDCSRPQSHVAVSTVRFIQDRCGA
jgi:hypothetical protein